MRLSSNRISRIRLCNADDIAVCGSETGLATVGRQKQPVCSSDFNSMPFQHVKALGVHAGDSPLCARRSVKDDPASFDAHNFQRFILRNPLRPKCSFTASAAVLRFWKLVRLLRTVTFCYQWLLIVTSRNKL